MPATPNLALPYPSASDTADVPRDIQALATRLDSLAEVGYWEITANPAAITATSEATAVTIIPGASVTYDGKPVLVEFQTPHAFCGAASSYLFLSLFDGAAVVARIGASQQPTAAPLRSTLRITPTAAAHTYNIRAHVSAGSGTIFAGAGGAGGYSAAFLRITRAQS